MQTCIEKAYEKHPHKILAWALMANHLHLLVMCQSPTLSRFMQLVQLRFAQIYNARLQRRGHLFQGRFTSIRVESGNYLLELVRYIHLNPIRAGILSSLDELDAYPLTGHSATVSGMAKPWHDMERMLSLFGKDRHSSVQGYRRLLSEGVGEQEDPALERGIWLVGARGLVSIRQTESSSRRHDFTGALIGSRDFARSLVRGGRRMPGPGFRSRGSDRTAIRRCFSAVGTMMDIAGRRLQGGSKSRDAVASRKVLVELLSMHSKAGTCDIARLLDISPSAVSKIRERPATRFENDCIAAISERYFNDFKPEGVRG